MDAFMESLFGHASDHQRVLSALMEEHGDEINEGLRREREQQQQQQQEMESKAAPPASRKAIRQLPTVNVTPEDLVDENNRECCICLDENNLGTRVTRLPCAHIYHTKCIHSWLQKHCTCPVCRYELPTDDPSYEPYRKERMRHRKPRYARYELERMSSHELHKLMNRLSLKLGNNGSVVGVVVEKRDLIKRIVESGMIDVIASPEPVEWKLGVLRKMGVGKLRKAMADAGVFFDAVDVVEKEDMVQIFVNSGRVVLIPEDDDDDDEDMSDVGEEQQQEYQPQQWQQQKQEQQKECEPSSTDLSSKTLSQLRMLAKELHVDIRDCIEKGEIVDKLSRRLLISPNGSNGSWNRQQQDVLPTLSVGELKALARDMNVDISDCIEKKEMEKRLLGELE